MNANMAKTANAQANMRIASIMKAANAETIKATANMKKAKNAAEHMKAAKTSIMNAVTQTNNHSKTNIPRVQSVF